MADFKKNSKINNKLLKKMIKNKKEFNSMPVIVGVDFGHTQPKITFSIGGEIIIEAKKEKVSIEILRH